MNVVWTDKAILSLRETNEFILELWNDSVSNVFLEQIDLIIEKLKINPGIGLSISNTTFKRVFIHKHVSLYYEVKNQTIVILLIWDNRQNPDMLSKKLR